MSDDDDELEVNVNVNVTNGSVKGSENVSRTQSRLSRNDAEVTFACQKQVIEKENASSIFAFVEAESGTF